MNSEQIDYFKNNISYYIDSSRSYFDSSSFTLVNDSVLDAFSSYYKAGGSRILTGLYQGTSMASTTVESCRKSLKDFFSVSSGELAFPLSRATGILQALYSLTFERSITIFPYTGLDHELWLPIFEFSKQYSLTLKPLLVKNTEPELESSIVSELKTSLTEVNVVILPLTSLGNGLTLSESLLQAIRSYSNTFIILDCTYAVGLSDINFSDLPIDIAICDSNIGLGGPIGSAIMYISSSFNDEMSPGPILGNGTIKKVEISTYSLEDMPQRMEHNINPSLFAGLTKSIEIINQISLQAIEEKISALKKYFFDQLQKQSEIQLLGSQNPDNYYNIIGFIIPGVNMHEIAMYLDEVHAIDIRSGSFCAHQLIDQLYEHLNLENSHLGILQVSFNYYNSFQEIDKLFSGISEFLNIFK